MNTQDSQAIKLNQEKIALYSESGEQIWKVFVASFFVILTFFCKQIVQLHQYHKLNDNLIAQNFNDELIYVSIAIITITLTKKQLCRFIKPYIITNYLDTKRYPTLEEQMIRRSLLEKMFTEFIWYSSMSFWGYILIKNQDFYSFYIGGSGDTNNIMNNYPILNDELIQLGLRHFYLIQLSFRIESFLFLIIHQKEKKFYEMGLHHIAASFLIFFSYVTNLTNFGLIVLFTHDFSDTFLIIARSITDFKYKSDFIINLTYLFFLIQWIYLRNFIMNFCAIRQVFKAAIFGWEQGFDIEIYEVAKNSIILQGIMLLFLSALNFYWSYKMLIVFHAKIFKNKILVEDHQNKQK